MSRFARLVHFGAIKMDVGFGAGLDLWKRDVWSERNGDRHTVRGGSKKLLREKLYTVGIKPKGHRPSNSYADTNKDCRCCATRSR
jgi:hypothetical protein